MQLTHWFPGLSSALSYSRRMAEVTTAQSKAATDDRMMAGRTGFEGTSAIKGSIPRAMDSGLPSASTCPLILS